MMPSIVSGLNSLAASCSPAPAAVLIGGPVEQEANDPGDLLVKIDLGWNQLLITKSYVEFKAKRLATREVTGIRYGILKRYSTFYLRTLRSYAIWLTNERQVLHIECDTAFTRTSVVEARYLAT